ncbi:hypothetical protein [uncultured Treponema sp.]|uniref:hypothetical protein n=1 Tax=uncultured Treponema sp. TaxID=162155 RepID=UPI00280A9754|nr:hypothetical protein [uncultured Treponema sp.]
MLATEPLPPFASKVTVYNFGISSSEPPLEPSEQEVNESAKLNARMHAMTAWGG